MGLDICFVPAVCSCLDLSTLVKLNLHGSRMSLCPCGCQCKWQHATESVISFTLSPLFDIEKKCNSLIKYIHCGYHIMNKYLAVGTDLITLLFEKLTFSRDCQIVLKFADSYWTAINEVGR